MMTENYFNIFVGGRSGVFKGIQLKEQKCDMKNIQNLVAITDDDRVTTIAWGDSEEKEVLIGCGVKGNRSVKVYDTEASMFTTCFFCNIGTGSINGISRYDGAILTAVHSGEVKLWRYTKEEEVVLETGPNLNRMRHAMFNKNLIATGGQEHRLQLFDIQTQKRIFTEKNLPHDSLELRIPIWISDLDFLPNSTEIVTCGRYGHIRLYDSKAQRRPVVNLEMKDEALTTLCVTPREKQIVVGSGKGKMNLIDLRKPGKILNTYKGFTGSVTGISCSATEPYIVSTSLDRHLRVHNMDTKQLIRKVYVTSNLTCLLLRSEFSLKTLGESDEQLQQNNNTIVDNYSVTHKRKSQKDTESDDEYDMLFDKMQTIGNKRDRKMDDIETPLTNTEVSTEEVPRKMKKMGKALKRLKENS